jgi:hypothetical protein
MIKILPILNCNYELSEQSIIILCIIFVAFILGTIFIYSPKIIKSFKKWLESRQDKKYMNAMFKMIMRKVGPTAVKVFAAVVSEARDMRRKRAFDEVDKEKLWFVPDFTEMRKLANVGGWTKSKDVKENVFDMALADLCRCGIIVRDTVKIDRLKRTALMINTSVIADMMEK